MLFVVEEDEAFDPVGVGFGGTGAEVSEVGCGVDLFEEFWRRHGQDQGSTRSPSLSRYLDVLLSSSPAHHTGHERSTVYTYYAC